MSFAIVALVRSIHIYTKISQKKNYNKFYWGPTIKTKPVIMQNYLRIKSMKILVKICIMN